MGIADVDYLHAGEVSGKPSASSFLPDVLLRSGTRERFARKPHGFRYRVKAIITLIVFFAAGVALRAHTPDTSYCKIAISPAEVSFTFTFDLTTLGRMTSVDVDRDGRVTRAELRSAAPAIETFVRRSVFIELNERESLFGPMVAPSWPDDAGDTIPTADFGQRLSTLVFRNDVLHAPESVAITFDFFGTLGERHSILGKFLWKGDENPVIFSRFEPDYLFDTGYRVPALEQFREYLWLGMTHIFLGYDHVMFLIALLFVKHFRELVKIITAFSVAHTLTLALAALGVVALPSRLVESAIAASIIYVAAENIWADPEQTHRWKLTFAFGLVHGFGFASVLRELGLPSEGVVRSLLAFNLGVELGQLIIAAACWPVLLWVGRQPWANRVRVVTSALLLACGAAWLVERAFALDFMPL